MNVGDLGKLIVAKGFKKLPKVQKSPNLVTLPTTRMQLSLVGGGVIRAARLA